MKVLVVPTTFGDSVDVVENVKTAEILEMVETVGHVGIVEILEVEMYGAGLETVTNVKYAFQMRGDSPLKLCY